MAPGQTGSHPLDRRGYVELGDWRVLVTLEYMRLQAPLDSSVIAAFAERELKDVQNRELSGEGTRGCCEEWATRPDYSCSIRLASASPELSTTSRSNPFRLEWSLLVLILMAAVHQSRSTRLVLAYVAALPPTG